MRRPKLQKPHIPVLLFRAVLLILPPALFAALYFLPPFAAGQTGEQIVFVTNSGEKYHQENCSALRRSKNALSLGDAVRSGYEPCGICKPPVLSGPPAPRENAPPELYRLNTQGIDSVDKADRSRMVQAEVVGHVDGDTVRLRIPNPPSGLNALETIRMIGVDTPETVHPRREVEYFGKEASGFTRQRLMGKPVSLAFDWDLRDRYGRLLAYIFGPDGDCHNAALIREGYAHAYTKYSFRFMEEFRRLEQEARQAKRGLWGP
jgi:micrococcal nuclease